MLCHFVKKITKVARGSKDCQSLKVFTMNLVKRHWSKDIEELVYIVFALVSLVILGD